MVNIANHVGFSGTREEMSRKQADEVYRILRQYYVDHYKGEDLWFHHGDCIGSDTLARLTATNLGYKVYRHPPLDDKFQAFTSYDATDPPYSYHGRNKRIVHACALLVATPLKSYDGGGGTWFTIKHARSINKPNIVIFRDGTVQAELHKCIP